MIGQCSPGPYRLSTEIIILLLLLMIPLHYSGDEEGPKINILLRCNNGWKGIIYWGIRFFFSSLAYIEQC